MKARMLFLGVLVAFLSATPLGSWADNLGQKADTSGVSLRRVLLGDAWPGTKKSYQETDTNGYSPRRVLLGDAWLCPSQIYRQETDGGEHSPRRVLLGDAWLVNASAAESVSSR